MALAHFQETIGRVLADGDVFIGSGASVEVRDETVASRLELSPSW